MLSSYTPEELVNYVWQTSGERTPLEHLLAETLGRALDELEDTMPEPGFGVHD